ncbi:MAG: META domain-containing protein [Burkholderiales bacterium]
MIRGSLVGKQMIPGAEIIVCAGLFLFALSTGVVHAGAIEECAEAPALIPCLDQKLVAANKQLNATLKAAQARLEHMQNSRRRLVQGAFVDSQRKFNAYRDVQCTWQSIRGAPGTSGLEFVKDCQIRETLARETALLAFINTPEEAMAADTPTVPPTAGAETRVNPAPPASESATAPAVVTAGEAPPVVSTQAPAELAIAASSEPAALPRGQEWQLAAWLTQGSDRPLLPGSTISIAFDPAGKIAGSASVNRYSGRFQFDVEGRLQWQQPPYVLTRDKGSPALMAQEKDFLAALRRTAHYRVEDRQLHLENWNGSVVLTFMR